MADSEDALQISIYKLETDVYQHGIKVPKNETKKKWILNKEVQ
jgi:hypothetical protein